MTRTRKTFAALAIAIAASTGVAVQSTASAAAADSHLPVVGAKAAGSIADTATIANEGHIPSPTPR